MAGRRDHRAGDAGEATGLIGRREVLLTGGAAAVWAGPAFAAGGPANTLPDVETPFQMDGGRPWTGVWINKQGPFRFLIASGTNTFSAWEDLAVKLKLNPTTAAVQTNGRHGSVSTVYEARELLIGGAFALTRVPLAAFRTPGTPSHVGQLPLVADRVTTFDFKAGVMRSLRSAPQDRAGYLKAAMIHEQNSVLTWVPQVMCKLGGKTVRLRIDTGARGLVGLNRETASRLGLWFGDTPYSERIVEGSVPTMTTRTVRTGDLEIGDVRVARPVVTLHSSAGSKEDPFEDDGFIGIDLLRRFDLIIDQPKRDLWMRPNADHEAPWSYDRAGFEVEEKDGAWRVSAVDKGSPAEAAGLKVGDQVLTQIDSVKRARFAPAGAQVAFSVLRGTERARIAMTLADWL